MRKLFNGIFSLFNSLVLFLFKIAKKSVNYLLDLEFKQVFNLIAKLGLLLILGLMLVVVVKSLKKEGYSIQVIQVPKDYNDAGYSPFVLANLLRDKIDYLIERASSIKDGQVKLETDNQVDLQMDVLGLGLSTNSLSYHIRKLLGIKNQTIKLELTDMDDQLRVMTRMTDQKPFYAHYQYNDQNTNIALDSLLESSAKSIMSVTDPYRLAVFYRRTNQVEQSMDVLRKMIDNKHQDEKWAWNLWGNINREKLRPEEAMECYKNAIALDETFETPKRSIGWMYYYKKDYENAIIYFKGGLQHGSHQVGAYNGLAMSYEALGMYDEAEKTYQDLLANHGDVMWMYSNYANFLTSVRKDTAAVYQVYKNAQNRIENKSEIYLSMAAYYAMKEDMDSSFYYGNKAYEHDPDNPTVLIAFANFYADDSLGNDYKLAVEFFDKAITALEKENIDRHTRQYQYIAWAECDYDEKEYSKAYLRVTEAIALDSSIAYPYLTRAKILLKLGDQKAFYENIQIAASRGYNFDDFWKQQPFSEMTKDEKLLSILDGINLKG